MSTSATPRKGSIHSMFDRIGDLIIKAIRLWRIFRSRRARRIFFHHRKEDQRAAALLKKRNDWKARRRGKKRKKSPSLRSIARLYRKWIHQFHRSSSPRKLLALYLGSAAVLSLILTAITVFSQTTPRSRPLPPPASPREEPLDKLLAQTARLFADNQLDAVQKNLDALNIRAPGNLVVLSYNGTMHMMRKNYPAARAAYNQALAVNPESQATRYNLAEIEFLTKNYPEAERLFHQMHQMNPRNEIVLFRLALCTILQNNDEGYQIHLGKLSPAGRSPAWHYATAARLIQDKKTHEATKLIQQARAIFGDQTTFYDTTFRQIGLVK